MNRAEMWARAAEHRGPWDMIVVGGGATGVGIAIDAASRGFRVLLLEQSDFGKGTSSRSTKLAHGGVRYLEKGDIGLVMEALKERGLLLQNAPHLVHDLAFIVPNYDGQFDDSRLLIHMVFTAFEQGATLLNYVQVTGVTKDSQDFVDGVVARDLESGKEFRVSARVVINATGAFADALRRTADLTAKPMIAPSQGIHLVFKSEFLPGNSAIMVPHTSDGRVLFAIPWHGHLLVGTTDTPVSNATLEPVAREQEIDFILATASQYLAKSPTRADVLSMFAGIRPLVKAEGAVSTAALSRDHVIHIDRSGLMTICGGKWTTYRHMAEDCVDQAITLAQLPERECVTRHLRIHGSGAGAKTATPLAVYGADAGGIERLSEQNPMLSERLHPALPHLKAEVVWAAREEMARTVEDVLARRTRSLFLNARASLEMASTVADLLAGELGWDDRRKEHQVSEFRALALQYLPS
jgi:glycerol-3-phosphate dehydrogenase